MKKLISIFGVTGSVGNSTIELLRKRKDEFEVIAITCNSDIKNISLLANEFNPKIVAVANVRADEIRSQRQGIVFDHEAAASQYFVSF